MGTPLDATSLDMQIGYATLSVGPRLHNLNPFNAGAHHLVLVRIFFVSLTRDRHKTRSEFAR